MTGKSGKMVFPVPGVGSVAMSLADVDLAGAEDGRRVVGGVVAVIGGV